LKRTLVTAGFVVAACAVLVTAALAANAGSGQSTGTATVFLPNPVADLQNQSLTDQKERTIPRSTARSTTSRSRTSTGAAT